MSKFFCSRCGKTIEWDFMAPPSCPHCGVQFTTRSTIEADYTKSREKYLEKGINRYFAQEGSGYRANEKDKEENLNGKRGPHWLVNTVFWVFCIFCIALCGVIFYAEFTNQTVVIHAKMIWSLLIVLLMIVVLMIVVFSVLIRFVRFILNRKLLSAIKGGNTSTVRTLLSIGADVNTKDKGDHDEPILIIAVCRGYTEIAQALINKGADIKAKDFLGDTVFVNAINYGRTEIALSLLDEGADANDLNRNHVNVLMTAAFFGYTEIAQALINKGAYIDSKCYRETYFSEEGGYEHTALMAASKKGHARIVKMLLQHGADVDLKDSEGRTALFFASEQGHTEVVQLLKSFCVFESTELDKPKQSFFRHELKKEFLDELNKELGSFAVNLVYMRTDDETNAADCFSRIVSQGNYSPCTAYAVIGELRSEEGASPGIDPGLFVGVVLHHWTLKALHEGQQWFFKEASNYEDMPGAFVVVKDKNYAELEHLPFSFYKFKQLELLN